DILCPFCYIGKRRFEGALKTYNGTVEVEWKSFQLDPDLKTNPNQSVTEMLAERKGWTLEYAQQASQHVTDMAKGEGLEYKMNKAVVANSFDAHRLIQFAKTKRLGDQAKEALFLAYFTEGKNIAAITTLVAIGKELGLDPQEVDTMLTSNQFSGEVNEDLREARMIGVTGVPFFVVDRKYAISGAQSSDTFVQFLEKASQV
ncbi:MAG: putative DsbA family dithiol-disulfide isomerase, partial [Cyclobacteriaceae bacterium]